MRPEDKERAARRAEWLKEKAACDVLTRERRRKMFYARRDIAARNIADRLLRGE